MKIPQTTEQFDYLPKIVPISQEVIRKRVDSPKIDVTGKIYITEDELVDYGITPE